MRMKKNLLFACLLATMLLMSCSSSDDDASNPGRGLIGRWDLVEIQNGMPSLHRDGNVTTYPSGTVVLEFMSNGQCVRVYSDGRKETADYSFPKDQEQYYSADPVLLLGEVPFSYTIEGDMLTAQNLGLNTMEHIPATYVFKRLR